MTSAAITVFDISSLTGSTGWRSTYWDAVGFSTAPSSITPNGCADKGAGSGTLTDTFRRAADNRDSSVCSYSDTFKFNTFTSGTVVRYTQHNNRQGWQFVSISNITFKAPC